VLVEETIPEAYMDKKLTTESLANLHPGAHLREDYFPEMGITEYRFAKLLGITQTHLADLLAGKRNVTANIALRLGRLFDQSPEMWMTLQTKYDIAKAMVEFGDDIERIVPFLWPDDLALKDQLAA